MAASFRFSDKIDAFADAMRGRLQAGSPAAFVAGATFAALALSLLFLSPRLFILLGEPVAGTFEWDRAAHFMAQAADPLGAEVEPALRWRFAPAMLAHCLHLRGHLALLVPWAGLIAFLAYLSRMASVRMADRLDAFLLTLFVGTLGCVQAVTLSHANNDGWLLLALLATSFSGRSSVRLLAALAGPWIDERYLLALPLTLVCRWAFPPSAPPGGAGRWPIFELGGIAPYLLIRICFTIQGDATSTSFVAAAIGMLPTYLPYVPLGWWMGLRAGWLLVALALLAAHSASRPRAALWLALTATAGMAAITILAADVSRSTNLILPLVCAGAFAADRIVGRHRTHWLLGLLGANLLLPFTMVTYTWVVPILPLPVELLRWLYHG